GSLGVVIVLALGGQNVTTGFWTIGVFSAYLSMFLSMSRRTWVAARVINRWHAARASWDRITEKLTMPLSAATKETTPPESITSRNLTVHNLTFMYPGSSLSCLHEVSFSVPYGSFVAITGPIGSGKSALAAALSGFYPYEGSIQFNGLELSSLTSQQKQSLISYNDQESFLFSTTIANNVSLADKATPDRQKVLAALSVAALADDLHLFPHKEDTMVGERGVRLSGGQRQRLALARAVYANKDVVILDDPFSAVDIATERRMILRLKSLFASKTVIILSHRLTSFPLADHVFVIDGGRIIQSGNHDSLILQEGIYRRIFNAQSWLEERDYA
ncbi:MAG: ABC transporter ATP-binding protein, partial [bacterium]|nr:ABC transporter ATP-binding protein [bacterium]